MSNGETATRQRRLPGHEMPTIPEIDEAAELYRKARDSRMKMLMKETDAGEKLLALMTERKLETYEYEGFSVSVTSLRKVRVKKSTEATNGEVEE